MFDLMPFGRNEKNLFNFWDNMEKSFFGNSFDTFSQFRTDILDNGDHYTLQAELPGFQKEDIKISIDGDHLNITAVHDESKEEQKDNFVRRERKYGSFTRSFDISAIDGDQITAAYKDGILELNLPKRTQTTDGSRTITIQ